MAGRMIIKGGSYYYPLEWDKEKRDRWARMIHEGQGYEGPGRGETTGVYSAGEYGPGVEGPPPIHKRRALGPDPGGRWDAEGLLFDPWQSALEARKHQQDVYGGSSLAEMARREQEMQVQRRKFIDRYQGHDPSQELSWRTRVPTPATSMFTDKPPRIPIPAPPGAPGAFINPESANIARRALKAGWLESGTRTGSPLTNLPARALQTGQRAVSDWMSSLPAHEQLALHTILSYAPFGAAAKVYTAARQAPKGVKFFGTMLSYLTGYTAEDLSQTLRLTPKSELSKHLAGILPVGTKVSINAAKKFASAFDKMPGLRKPFNIIRLNRFMDATDDMKTEWRPSLSAKWYFEQLDKLGVKIPFGTGLPNTRAAVDDALKYIDDTPQALELKRAAKKLLEGMKKDPGGKSIIPPPMKAGQAGTQPDIPLRRITDYADTLDDRIRELETIMAKDPTFVRPLREYEHLTKVRDALLGDLRNLAEIGKGTQKGLFALGRKATETETARGKKSQLLLEALNVKEREIAINYFEQSVIQQSKKQLTGSGKHNLEIIDINKALDKLRDLKSTNPTFVRGIGKENLDEVIGFFEKHSQIMERLSLVGPGALQLYGQFSALGVGAGMSIGSIFGPGMAAMGGLVGAKMGVQIPRKIADVLLTKIGRRILTKTMEFSDGLLTPRAIMVSAFFAKLGLDLTEKGVETLVRESIMPNVRKVKEGIRKSIGVDINSAVRNVAGRITGSTREIAGAPGAYRAGTETLPTGGGILPSLTPPPPFRPPTMGQRLSEISDWARKAGRTQTLQERMEMKRLERKEPVVSKEKIKMVSDAFRIDKKTAREILVRIMKPSRPYVGTAE